MTCDAILPHQPALWVEDRPFLLWDIGPRCVLDHFMDKLFLSNATLRLWLEAPDEDLYAYICETFPLNRRVQVTTGAPTSRPEACTFLDAKGSVVIRRGPQLTPFLPKQPTSRTWFNMVKGWLAELQATGSQTPELETQISPGVFIGHHGDVSKDTTFIAPCWVGSGCTLRGATIGPNVVIGDDCIISHGSRIAESYLISETYVAPGSQINGLAVGPAGCMDHATGLRVSTTSSPTLSNSPAPAPLPNLGSL